jgi:hypothetical protein
MGWVLILESFCCCCIWQQQTITNLQHTTTTEHAKKNSRYVAKVGKGCVKSYACVMILFCQMRKIPRINLEWSMRSGKAIKSRTSGKQEIIRVIVNNMREA